MTDQESTSGVQELIDRLSQEGVAEGKQQAEKIVSDAQKKADDIIDSARQQANEILRQAREEADHFQKAGQEALRLAARDAVRDFGARIHDGLRNRLQELVQHQIKEPKLIKRMILEVSRRATAGLEGEEVEILLPPEIVTEEAARKKIQAGDRDTLTEFVQGLLGEDLRTGVAVNLGRGTGMTVRVVNQNVEIDLTEESITDLLAQHLLPRFRAIMRQA